MLYHVSDIDYKLNILADGLVPSVTNAISNETNRIGAIGIFFWDNLDSARHFGSIQPFDYCIFGVADIDKTDLIKDPEYDGDALFFETNTPVPVAKIIEEGV